MQGGKSIYPILTRLSRQQFGANIAINTFILCMYVNSFLSNFQMDLSVYFFLFNIFAWNRLVLEKLLYIQQ